MSITSIETERLAALRDLDISNTPAEAHFDAACRIARDLFCAPIALVSFVEEDRQWFKAKCGVDFDETAREIAFCHYTVQSDDVMVVEDAAADPRFATSPLVRGGLGVRFYAGVPLALTPGIRIGAFCIKDTQPRSFSSEQRRQLRDLAEIVLAHLRLHESRKEQEAKTLALQTAYETQRIAERTARVGHFRMDVRTRAVTWSDGIAAIFGVPMPVSGTIALDGHVGHYHPNERMPILRDLDKVAAGVDPDFRDGFRLQRRVVRPDGEERVVTAQCMPVRDASGRVAKIHGVLFDVTPHIRAEERLLETSVLLRMTLENMDQGLISFGPDHRVRVHNRMAREIAGMPPHVLHDGALMADLQSFVAGRGALSGEDACPGFLPRADDPADMPRSFERTRPDGRAMEARGTPLADGGIIWTLTDITQRRLAERAIQASEARLKASEERLAYALDNGTDGLWDWDLVANTAWLSDRWFTMLGYTVDDADARAENWLQLVHAEDTDRVLGTLRIHLKGHTPTFESEYRLRRKDGGFVWILSRGSVVARDGNGRALRIVGVHIDISARKAAEAQLTHLAAHDALTGLANRSMFGERLDHELRRARKDGGAVALLACDLDRFKIVNDTFGHLAGDRLLLAVADRLRSVIGRSGTVCRLGGDEFAIILSESDRDAVILTAQRIVACVGHPVDLGDHVCTVGISIGIAVGPGDGGEAEALRKSADLALYRAKTSGRNGYCFYESLMDEAAASRTRLEHDMREAIQRGGFVLHYQPVMCLATGRVSGCEALMRWQHPLRGAISPAEFIPLAEESVLIVALGTWALQEACREAATWPGEVRVAVNVSAIQFSHPGLEQGVVAALAASGLAPDRLELEITESVLMEDSASTVACLHRLHALGVRIALDDFGTGYSSLSYLRRFPFDKIKIDRSFIREIAEPDTAVIVRAIVGLAERLGAVITAEGIETDEQLAQVRTQGCTEVQGFYFSRPLPAAEALDLMTGFPGRAAA